MLRVFVFSLVIVLVFGKARSQTKEFETRQQTWFGVFNQTRLTNHSGIWLDLHLRLNDGFVNEMGATIVRVGYTYHFNDQARLTLGYAHQTHYGHNGGLDVPEHRPWQQIQWVEKKSWFNMMQWIRFEQRFRRKSDTEQLIDGYNFNYRIRYNMAFTVPLKGKQVVPKTPFLFANNEVFINLGEDIVNNYFDQNRAFIGLGYQFTSHLNAQLGYMNIFQQLPTGNKYVNTHTIRLFVFHHLDLRRKG